MLDAQPLPKTYSGELWRDRLVYFLIISYQAAALLVYLAVPVLALGWLRRGEPLLARWPFWDQTGLLYIPYPLGLICLGASFWVLRTRHRDPAGRAFAVLATSLAICLGALFDLYSTQQLLSIWTLALALTGGALFNMGVVFPEEIALPGRSTIWRWLGYLPALILALIALAAIRSSAGPGALYTAWRYEFAYIGLGAIFYVGWLISRRYASASPITRAQARTILWGALAAGAPLSVWLLAAALRPNLSFSPYLLLPLVIFPLFNGYAILRYRLVKTDTILSRTMLYTLLTLLAAAGYAFLVTGLSLLFQIPIAGASPFAIGLLAAVLALGLNPLRDRLQKMIDGIFFRGQRVYQDHLQAFSHELTRAVEIPAITRLLRRSIEGTLQPIQLHVYVYDALSDQYTAAPDGTGRPTSDLRFPANSALAQSLSRRQAAFYLERSATLPRALHQDWSRMSLLGTQFFIPMPGQQQLIGWITLGPRRSGEPYSEQDLAYLEALGDQAALALERARVVDDLERRVHQMNVLTRVAQGVTVTSAFDDILELLYAQTNQVLPTQDFFITLHDEAAGTTSHAFYLEANERLDSREGRPLAAREGLVSVVIETGRTLITEDYARECRQQAVIPVLQGIYAFMSVPLNTSDATIGALSLGSRDPAVVYTPDQRDILQALADQAAGAIAKSRLLQETERRARQLASLNDVAQSLSSTLDLDQLLDQILKSAVNILDCEAGSLFMIDEPTGDLIFAVTEGPVASNLVGQRLPSGTGLVGKAADSRQPIIANDVAKTQDWSGETDEQTGFVTQSMLVVPLLINENAIGVIEVINKRDGANFTPEEQELLAVFTGQAAVAIENARLYTLTDQALAARVEELSVMQRIDRELNTSLDIQRATSITLEWALRQSGSDAGLVGVVDDEGFQVLAAQGYPGDLDLLGPPREQAPLPAIETAIRTGAPQLVEAANDTAAETLLPDAHNQIAVPIRREADVIGVLFLESRQPDRYPEENLRFLTRLSDHAAIAIANADLYAEVQAANLAKSDFVSFVSHELKTPMTSIKGYADLLAAGSVGPVTEAQANFLSTIRSNVNRMATLVSDLADISRIEAGRLRLEFSAVDIAEVVEEVVRSTQNQVEEKEQTLIIELPEDLAEVWGDRTRLIQVLTNLVSNAHKYSEIGGEIRIHAEQDRNTWDPDGAQQVVHLLVQDNGIGISAEDQVKIFQKFFRSDDQKAREAPGTGLGLNITKSLVEMQGGMIWFESEFRKGTTFHFTIPVIEAT
jgi:signal transduction histidine kinase